MHKARPRQNHVWLIAFWGMIGSAVSLSLSFAGLLIAPPRLMGGQGDYGAILIVYFAFIRIIAGLFLGVFLQLVWYPLSHLRLRLILLGSGLLATDCGIFVWFANGYNNHDLSVFILPEAYATLTLIAALSFSYVIGAAANLRRRTH